MSNTVTVSPLGRRAFLSMAAGVWAAPGLLGAAAGRTRRISWGFSMPPEKLAELLPPGLELGGQRLVRLDIETVEPTNISLLESAPWGWARLMVEAQAGEAEGWMPLRLYVSNERALRVARERYGLPAMPAEITLGANGDRLTAAVRVAGKTVFEVSGAPGEPTAEPHGETIPALVWSGEPSLDWMGAGGLLSGGSISRLDLQHSSQSSRRLEEVQSPWPEAGSVWASYNEGSAAPPAPGTVHDPVTTVSAADAAAWSPLSYPTTITAAPADPLQPSRLSDARLKSLETQKEIRLGPLEACELDMMIAQEAHEAMLPPMCRSGGRPMVKMLGLRVHESELSPEPFQEVWLFAFAIVAGRAGWFAISHITEPQGDVVHGREAFGYPTKLGSPDIVATPLDFRITVNRLGREVAYGRGMFKGFATGTSLGQLPMMTLRAKRGGESAEILFQPWTFQGRRSRVDPATLEVSFPGAKAKGMEQLSDPWSELNPLRPLAVSAMDGAAMQRGPAQVLLEWKEFGEYYRERCDGVLPWEPEPSEFEQPTLLVGGTASGPRS